MPDVVGMTGWLAELIAERTANDAETQDFALVLDDGPGRLAVLNPLEPAVYLITVQEAQLVPASNTEPDPASSPIPCGACPPCLNGVESECESSPASEPRVLFDTPEATMWSDGVLRIQESNTESKP